MPLIRLAILFFACFMALPMSLTWAAESLFDKTRCELQLLSMKDQVWRAGLAMRDVRISAAEVSKNIEGYGLWEESDRLAVAKIAVNSIADDYSFSFAEYVQKFRIYDQSELIILAKTAATRGDPYIIGSIKNFGIKDQKALLEVLEIALKTRGIYQGPTVMQKFLPEIPDELLAAAQIYIQHAGFCISEIIEDFKIQDQNILFELAKMASLKVPNSGYRFYLQNFSLNEENTVHIAKWLAEHDPKFSEQFEPSQINNESTLIELAKLAAPHDPFLSSNIKKFKIKNKRILFDIAKIHAQVSFNDSYAAAFHNFDIESEGDRIELAKILAANPKNGTAIIFQLPIKDPQALIEIARIAAQTSGPRLLWNIDYFNFNDDHLKEIVDLAFSYPDVDAHIGEDNLEYFIQSFNRATNRPILLLPYIQLTPGAIAILSESLGLNFNANQPLPTLEAILTRMRLDEFIPLLQDHSKHAEVSIRLFQEIFRAVFKAGPEVLNTLKSRMDSLSLIEIGLGLPDHTLDRWVQFSNDRKGTAFELALEIIQLAPQLLSDSLTAIRLLQSPQSLDFLNLLRDILSLDSQSKSEIQNILKSADSIQVIHNLKQTIEKKLKVLFQNSNFTYSYDSFLQLRKTWGNVEPVITLLARYKQRTDWDMEIPWLTHVFDADLKGRFLKLKFEEGVNEEDQRRMQRQLDFLSLDQKRQWIKKRTRVQVFSPDNNQSTHSSDRAFFETLTTNLLPHLEDALKNIETVVDVEKMNHVKKVITDNKDPMVARSILKQTLDEHEIIRSLQIHLRVVSLNKAALKPFLIYLNTHADHIQIPEFRILAQQIRSDIKDLMKEYRSDQKRQFEKLIVLTIVLNDAKNLLTVGDLVDCSSCQNYRTGTYIQTLLGYVLDANVQAVLSYAISQSDFANPQDYFTALKVTETHPESVHFNPQDRRFYFSTGDSVVVTQHIPKAYHRQILKLGKTSSGAPGLRLERAYQQNHAALHLMKEQTQRIFADLKRDIDAKDGTVYIPRSRNPGGVYSDASGGMKTEAYEIK